MSSNPPSQDTQLTLIVDRVGKTNIFNIIKNDSVATPYTNFKESLITDVDSDLIEEYLTELSRIASVSKSLSNLPRENEENQALIFQHLNLNEKLRQIGQILFKQLFPESLQKMFQQMPQASLFLHIDPQLAAIPFELLHDGEVFLWQKFFIGKNIKGGHISSAIGDPRENLSILIIADPTEDLEWARHEGELLFENLSSYFSDRNVSIELMGGKSITKLSLLNAIVDKNIIHYCGHLFHSDNPEENGWVLANQKIIHAREIKNSGANPLLYFSNSCLSALTTADNFDKSNGWYADFAASFLQSASSNYIGTNWEIKDNRPTLEFTLNFYRELLKGSSLGQSLNSARKISFENNSINDLTWSSYLLLGNPAAQIFASDQKVPDVTKNMLDYVSVFENMPMNIAEAFWNFCKIQEQKENAEEGKEREAATLPTLFELYRQCVFFLGALVFANYRYLRLPGKIIFDTQNCRTTLKSMYNALRDINNLKSGLFIPNLLEVLFIHKDNLTKIANWKEDPSFEEKIANSPETFEITIQYILENLLIDLELLKLANLYRIMEPGHKQYSLRGLSKYHSMREILLPTQTNKENLDDINEKTEELVGTICYYNPIKKLFLNLSPYIKLVFSGNEKKQAENSYRLIFNDSNEEVSDKIIDLTKVASQNFAKSSTKTSDKRKKKQLA